MSDSAREAEELEEQPDAAERKIAALQWQLQLRERAFQDAADVLEKQLETANREAVSALQQRDAVLGSLFWRITGPLRRAAAAVPVSFRWHVRRAAKAAWWAATPWRMPQRLKLLRQRHEAEKAMPAAPVQSTASTTVSGAADGAYGRWIARHERRGRSSSPHSPLSRQLTFMVCATARRETLERTISSIRSQPFSRWQIVIAVPITASPEVSQYVQALSAQESRIVGIDVGSPDAAAALSACFPAATGEFIALLDSGDVLAAGASDEIANALSIAPDSEILYSDEDELSNDGFRAKPYFKPSWSPELLYSFNYFGRLTLLQRKLALAVGGVDSSMGAGFEWDLNLRASHLAQAITRIPRVLCHRGADGSRGRSLDPVVVAGHQSALRKYWAQCGIEASLQTQPDGTQRATWPITAPPLVSIIIPSKNKDHLLRMCLEGLLKGTDYRNKEIIIVDTGSTEPATLSYYEELRVNNQVRIVHFNKKFNYSAACNYGSSFARGEMLLFLNNDIEVISRDWLDELVRVAMRPGVGVVGTKLVFPSGELQHGGVGVGIHLCGLMYRSAQGQGWELFGSPETPRNWLAIMGACQLVTRNAFERVGGFDESYLVAMSDVALCLQIWRAGFRIAYTPHACLVHHEGATRGNSNPTDDMRRIADDIRSLGVDEDPYLHPELDGGHAIPRLRLGEASNVRESLASSIRQFGTFQLPSGRFDLASDGDCLKAAGLSRERVIWCPQPAHAVSDIWSAARWCLDLLRTNWIIRARFPSALSGGASGDFALWLSGEDGTRLGLSDAAKLSIQDLFSQDISARARQAFLFHAEVRAVLPHGLLPAGQRDLFHWFMQHGRIDANLRLEEIWWLFLRASESPAFELVRAFQFTPAWQTLYPDGLTVFGRRAFAAWFSANYRVSEPWVDPSSWPVDIEPAQQLRSAYLAREQWQQLHPRAFDEVDHAIALMAWLRSPSSGQAQEVRDWCSALDQFAVANEMITPGVNVIGHFSYPSGLRVSVEALVEGLHTVGVRTAVRDLRTDKKDDPFHERFRGFEDFDITIIHTQPDPFFGEAYERSDVSERLPKTYRIAYWYWEFDSVPESWIEKAEGVDEVWTATEFVAKGLRERLSVPVRTVFPGVRLGTYQRRAREYFGLREGTFTFLFTFHMMSVMERKNPLGLIRAFRAAFAPSDDVSLVLKTSFGDRHPVQLQELRDAAADHNNIIVIDEVYSSDEVLSLMDACDAYVSLHRSEGLGLTMAEAMLMGKPVIATNYSGNTDFMTDADSLLVPYELVKLGRPIPPYDENLEWAEPSTEHASRLMRRLYEDPEWAREMGSRAKARAEVDLSLEESGRRAAARLAEVSKELRARRAG